MKNKNKQRKMPIVAIAALAIIGIVGGTIAVQVWQNKQKEMEYHTKPYVTTTSDTVESTLPEPNVPGDTPGPEVDFTNDNDFPVAVRVTVEHSWFGKNGDQIAAIQEQTQEDSTKKLVPAAVMTLTDQETKWHNIADVLKAEGTEADKLTSVAYHYYKTAVPAKGKIEKIFDKIVYSKDIIIDTTCTNEETISEKDGKSYTTTTTTCQNTDSTYADAKHKVKYTIESTPYVTYKEVWEDVEIAES